MSGKEPPENSSNKHSTEVLDFLSAVFPETNAETLLALLSAAEDDPARVVERLIRQEAVDHQESVVEIAREEDPLAMLQSVYPLLSPSLIQSAWIRCNGDVALAAEHLLNPSQEIPLTARILPPKAERGSPGDVVLQVPKKTTKNNHKAPTDGVDALQDLAAVFPDQPLDLLRQVLQESQGQLDLAAMKVSQWTMDDFRKEQHLQTRLSRDIDSLRTLFPSRSKATLESLLERYGHLDAVIDYLSTVDESSVALFSEKDLADLCEGDCIASGFPCLLHASDSMTTRTFPSRGPTGSKKNTWNNGDTDLELSQRDIVSGASFNHRRTTSSNSQVSIAPIFYSS
jgi:hypothetical protein